MDVDYGVRRLRDSRFGLLSRFGGHLEEAVGLQVQKNACHPSDPDLLVAKHGSWSILCFNVQRAEPRLFFHHMQHVIDTTHRVVHVHHTAWPTGAYSPFPGQKEHSTANKTQASSYIISMGG